MEPPADVFLIMDQPQQTDPTGMRVARGAAGMFGLKLAYSGLGFAQGILLARTLHPAGLGMYSYAMSWAVFLGVPASLGLDRYVVRRVAIDREKGDWKDFRGLLAASNRAGLLASALLISLAGLVAAYAARSGHRDAALTVLVGLLLVPILTLMKIRQAALSGLGQVVRGQWPELLVHPLFLMTMLGGASILAERAVSSVVAMAMTVLSSGLVLFLGARLLRASTPPEARQDHSEPVVLPWRRSLAPLVAVGTIQMLQSQADTLLLGLFASPRAVGIYGVASRGAQLVTFFLAAAAPALGPMVASLHSTHDSKGLERIVVKTARATFLLSLPVGLGLIVFGRLYLSLFGADFSAGALALAILCVGQLVNVACGANGLIMVMTGHEAAAARAIGIAAVVNLVSCSVMIPLWGLNGAAVGSATSLVIWNALLVVEVRRLVGIRCTPFARLSRESTLDRQR